MYAYPKIKTKNWGGLGHRTP